MADAQLIPSRLLLLFLATGVMLPGVFLGCDPDLAFLRGGASPSGGGGAGPVEDFVCPGTVGDVFDPGQVYYTATELGSCVTFVGRWCNPYEASAGIRCPVAWNSFLNIRPSDGRLIYLAKDEVGGDTIREYRCDHGCEHTPGDDNFVDLSENDPIIVDPICDDVIGVLMAPTGSLVYACWDQDHTSHYDEAGDFFYGPSLRALGFDNIVLDDNGTLVDLASPDSVTVIEGVPNLSTAAVRASADGGFYLAVQAESGELSLYLAHRDGSSELVGVYPSLSIDAFQDGVLGADLSYFQLTDDVVVRHQLGEPALVVYDRAKHGAFPMQLATGP